MRYTRILSVSVLLILLALSLPSFAQSDRGAISGTVFDASGAAIAGAQVTAVNQSTGETRTAKTNSEGSYLFAEIQAAPWKLKVEAKGFAPAETGVFRVAVQITRNVDVKLQVGATGTSVDVVGNAQTIETENPVLSTNVSERQVKEMPLAVGAEIGGRTPLAFIFLDSNVTSSDFNRQQNATYFRVNGGQALGADILVDGSNTRRAQNGSFFTEVAPGPQAFQEFTYSTTNYSAEFGSSSSGVVNFTLKSGTNKLHGEASEFFRNEALDANSWRNKDQKLDRPRDRQNDYGFNVGGPVYIPKLYDGRNKAFFFFNYGGYKFNQSENTYITVPTLKMRTGDFSELLTDRYVLSQLGGPQAIYDPHVAPGSRNAPIPGNRLDLYQGGAALDKVGMAIMSYFPKPTRDGVYRNYLATSNAPVNMNSEVVKVDQVLSDKQRLSASYTYREQTAIKGGFPRMPYPAIATGVWDQTFKSHFARAQHDYTISNNMLNHFNVGWNRVYVANNNMTYGFDTLSVGLPSNATANLAFPMVEFPGYNGDLDPRAAQGIGSTFWHDYMGDNQVELSDSLSWVRGRHTIKLGADLRIQQLNVFQNFDNGGHFNFRHDQTSGLDANGNQTGGWTLASLATGATEWSWVTLTPTRPAWRYLNQGYFINDDFKVNSRLTLNLGFRYEYQRPRVEAHDFYRAFDPTAMNPEVGRAGALAGAAGQGGLKTTYQGMFEPNRTDFSPRVGFAYSLNTRTVVRGGIGLYYAPYLYDASSGILGYRAWRNIIPPYSIDHGWMSTSAYLSTYPAHPSPDPAGQFIGSDVDYYQKDAKTGRTEQWSLGLERELPWNMMASASYIGNKGTRLRSNLTRINALPFDYLKLGAEVLNRNINDVTAADRAYAGSLGITLPTSANAVYQGFNWSVAQALRPFPQYNHVNNLMESRGQSWYNALNLRLDKRFSQGLQFGVAYTWSKLITTAGDDLWGNTPLTGVLQNPFDTRSIRALSPTNAANVVVFNYIYELPFGKGKQFLNRGGIVDKIVGGWQINGIHRYQGGMPIVVSINGGNARGFLDTMGYGGNLRPNLTGKPILLGGSLTGANVAIVNPAAFSAPAEYGAAPTKNVSDPAYAAYYANPMKFFGTAPAVLNSRILPYYSENFSLLKKFRISESMTAELGAEAFNLFNRHRYWMPDTNLDGFRADGTATNGNFGMASVTDTTAYTPRSVQLRARFTF
jgi:hypothetical protein